LHEQLLIFFRGGYVSFQTKARSLRNSLLVLFSVIALAIAVSRAGFAQSGFDRKIKNKVPPSYPEIARKLALSGTVRLEIVVGPDGQVKNTKVIGGHPILVSAAVDAVKKWKFETAGGDSTGTVEFRFDPGN